MLKACWLWFVILKKFVELTSPKTESRDPIFFTGTRARSRVSGNDRLFLRGSRFGPNPEIPASPVVQLRPWPGQCKEPGHQQLWILPSWLLWLQHSVVNYPLIEVSLCMLSLKFLEHFLLLVGNYVFLVSGYIWVSWNLKHRRIGRAQSDGGTNREVFCKWLWVCRYQVEASTLLFRIVNSLAPGPCPGRCVCECRLEILKLTPRIDMI